MRRVVALTAAAAVAAAAILGAAPLQAQAPECEEYGNTQTGRVCRAAVDGTRAFHPVAGLLGSGGNPLLGSGGSLGGFGHFALTARVNAVRVVLPDLDYDGSTTTVAAGENIVAPAPLLEGAVGVYRGFSNGFLAIDVLGSALVLPTDVFNDLTVDPDAPSIGSLVLGLGYGLRVGVLAERGLMPGVSVSVMRRNTPELRYGSLAAGDDYTYAVDLNATNVRVTAGKTLGTFALAAGLGWDKYTGDATIVFRNPITTLPEPPIDVELDNSRVMAFANAGVDLRVVKLVLEGGYQGGRDQRLTTDFEDVDTKSGKFFGALGLRFGL